MVQHLAAACRSRRYVTPLKRQDLQNTGVVKARQRAASSRRQQSPPRLGTSRLRDGNGIHISIAIAGKHVPMRFRFAFIPCASLPSPMHRPAGEKPGFALGQSPEAVAQWKPPPSVKAAQNAANRAMLPSKAKRFVEGCHLNRRKETVRNAALTQASNT
jgi:hypothetical protein